MVVEDPPVLAVAAPRVSVAVASGAAVVDPVDGDDLAKVSPNTGSGSGPSMRSRAPVSRSVSTPAAGSPVGQALVGQGVPAGWGGRGRSGSPLVTASTLAVERQLLGGDEGDDVLA